MMMIVCLNLNVMNVEKNCPGIKKKEENVSNAFVQAT